MQRNKLKIKGDKFINYLFFLFRPQNQTLKTCFSLICKQQKQKQRTDYKDIN